MLVLGYMVVQGKGEAHLAAGGALSVLLEEALPALFPDAAAEAFDKVRLPTAIKRMWHTYDSQSEILALTQTQETETQNPTLET